MSGATKDAALSSAGGGEAVGWQCRHVCPEEGPGTWTDIDARHVEMMRCKSDFEVRALYTAPTPQPQGDATPQVAALDVFRIAGGDVECCPEPTAAQALDCLRDLRACYDEALSTPAPTPQAQGERDGERYRALVESGNYSVGMRPASCPWGLHMSGSTPTKAEMDTAVDSFIAAQQPKGAGQ